MLEILIKGGTIVDGSGGEPYTGDVGIRGGKIVEMGKVQSAAEVTIDAGGAIVAPGWVDAHTHYDGQAMWDQDLTPSSFHGVTTAIIGNCGVGFAPVRPQERDYLIGLMEGVEDIPAQSLAAGLTWDWETFPEYLHCIDTMSHTMDIGALLTHGPLRVYAMGRDAVHREQANATEVERMAQLTQEAVAAGALGFSTSRTVMHTAPDGTPVPGTFAAPEELIAIGKAVKAGGGRLLEVVPRNVGGEDKDAFEKELQLMERLSRETGCAVTYLLLQHGRDREEYRRSLAFAQQAQSRGADLWPQVAGRPITMLMSFVGENPFNRLPAYQALLDKPWPERLAALKTREVRAALLSQSDEGTTGKSLFYHKGTWKHVYPMGKPMNYFPDGGNSVAVLAEKSGKDPREIAYDLMLEHNGTAFLMYAISNYFERTDEAVHTMLSSARSVWGLGDGGAHVTSISDASLPTFMLAHWVRDQRRSGARSFGLPEAVRRLTSANAQLFGLADRGLLAVGKKADLNVMDLAHLGLEDPGMAYDLPLGNPRLVQRARGYVATVLSGEVVAKDGELTGRRPGRLARSQGGR